MFGLWPTLTFRVQDQVHVLTINEHACAVSARTLIILCESGKLKSGHAWPDPACLSFQPLQTFDDGYQAGREPEVKPCMAEVFGTFYASNHSVTQLHQSSASACYEARNIHAELQLFLRPTAARPCFSRSRDEPRP